MKNKKSITNQKKGSTLFIKKRPVPFTIRLSKDEKRTLESLRVRWQYANYTKVIHSLIGMVSYLEDRFNAILREQEETLKKYRLEVIKKL